MGCYMQQVTLETKQRAELRFGKADCRFEERFEHRLEFKCRAADDLEHVGGGGLLLQRFTQLVEQPRILDGDDGLIGEGLNELQLFVGKGTGFRSENDDRTDRLSIPK